METSTVAMYDDAMLLDKAPREYGPLPSPPSSASPDGSVYDPLETPEPTPTKPAPGSRHLMTGLHVMSTEAAALANLARVYETELIAQEGFELSVNAIADCQRRGGKVVVTGVGKSGLIGRKLVATLQSLAIPAVNLHPTEALHGDMGMITHNDLMVVITFSGATAELLTLLPYLDESLPMILLTRHMQPEGCEFLQHRPTAVLLPAPVVETEKVSFGFAAPSTSTTVALAVGDAVAIAAAKELHIDVEAMFARNHPGGAIGAAFR